MKVPSASVGWQREQIQQQRVEAYEAWQLERVPVQRARDVLDPQGFMYRRAQQLVLERREQSQREPDKAYDPMSDLLGGARMVAAFEEAGEDTSEVCANHRHDIRTLFTEALLKGGHISAVETNLNAQGEAAIGGLAHWELFLRAAHSGDSGARTAEIAEEFYAASLFRQPHLRDKYDLLVISPSRPEIQGDTLMVRRMWFEQQDGQWKRKSQQLYIHGSHEADVNQWLRELAVLSADQPDMTAVDILSQPLLVRQGSFGQDIAGLGEMLDAITAERLGQPVFCGVPMSESIERSRYRDLLGVSQAREQAIEHHITTVEQTTLGLVRSQTLTFEEENQRFATMFITTLRAICKDHPEYAEAAFGSDAAAHYWASYAARQRGDAATAENEIQQAFSLSVTADACETTFSLAVSGKAEVSAYASLREKYGSQLKKGACLACQKGNEHQLLGPCGFCNDCDRHDRLRPGYIANLIERQQKDDTPQESIAQGKPERKQTVTAPKIRHGQVFMVGEERLEFRHKIQIGGTTPIFVSEDGQEIAGERAQLLYKSLLVAEQHAV